MTEDTSPENLHKFLESDDPALIMMGLSMAKGIDFTDDLLEEILWMYMMHDDKTIRSAAKSTFMKIAPEDAKLAVKQNWKASYRELIRCARGNLIEIELKSKANESLATPACLSIQLSILEKALSNTSLSLVGVLIKELGIDAVDRFELEWDHLAAETLSIIGDNRALEPISKLINSLKKKYAKQYYSFLTQALNEFGTMPSIDDLWQTRFESSSSTGHFYTVTIEAKQYHCSCPSFHFRKRCKHLRKAKVIPKDKSLFPFSFKGILEE